MRLHGGELALVASTGAGTTFPRHPAGVQKSRRQDA